MTGFSGSVGAANISEAGGPTNPEVFQAKKTQTNQTLQCLSFTKHTASTAEQAILFMNKSQRV